MERVEDGSSLNAIPPMFHAGTEWRGQRFWGSSHWGWKWFDAGISNKFTKRHLSNFRDTTLTAASAAKQRAERKLERQADAIEKQQQKIDNEVEDACDCRPCYDTLLTSVP